MQCHFFPENQQTNKLNLMDSDVFQKNTQKQQIIIILIYFRPTFIQKIILPIQQ